MSQFDLSQQLQRGLLDPCDSCKKGDHKNCILEKHNPHGRGAVSCTCRHVFHRKTKKQEQDDLRQRLQDQARKSREKIADLKRRPPIPVRRRVKRFQDKVR